MGWWYKLMVSKYILLEKGITSFIFFCGNMEILGFDPNQWMWMDGSIWLFDE